MHQTPLMHQLSLGWGPLFSTQPPSSNFTIAQPNSTSHHVCAMIPTLSTLVLSFQNMINWKLIVILQSILKRKKIRVKNLSIDYIYLGFKGESQNFNLSLILKPPPHTHSFLVGCAHSDLTTNQKCLFP